MEEKKTDTRNNGNATAATRAKNKYRDKNYDRMELALPKGMKAEIDKIAKEQGYSSRNEFVVAAINEKKERG